MSEDGHPRPYLENLSPDQRARVLDALAAVETYDLPVPEEDFPALSDSGLRAHVEACLKAEGRVLIHHEGLGYTSGYADAVTDALVSEGAGLLDEKERAVLAVILLRCVAMPRSLNREVGRTWFDAVPTTRQALKESQYLNRIVDDVLPRLYERRLIRYVGQGRGGILPGHQFRRLTPAASDRLWDRLNVVCEPDGLMAAHIRQRLGQGLSGTSHDAAADPHPSTYEDTTP
ncbi:hypothetical protein GTW20_21065 [Nocardiopsis alba]|uniref:DUF4194 domain-containing protein n=1 Tax=Nocardiopsis alba TaxID=53437 RepID=A0A7K2IXF5_9ACTN|nr:hypothetical protein [Nocardiopsis alba]MYR34670.1 hypothetical protein [Nocardiopsis alba]